MEVKPHPSQTTSALRKTDEETWVSNPYDVARTQDTLLSPYNAQTQCHRELERTLSEERVLLTLEGTNALKSKLLTRCRAQ